VVFVSVFDAGIKIKINVTLVVRNGKHAAPNRWCQRVDMLLERAIRPGEIQRAIEVS
jgi:hypothetical protein